MKRVQVRMLRTQFPPDSPLLLDRVLLYTVVCLCALGLIMVTSSSIAYAEKHMHDPLYYIQRQLVFLAIGSVLACYVFSKSTDSWYRMGPLLLLGAFVLLGAVLLPNVGKTVNNSTRWIALGWINVQVSEIAKIWVIIYLSGYLVRHSQNLRTRAGGFLYPLGLVLSSCVLLLAEPDFGAAVVLLGSALLLMYLAGVRTAWFLYAIVLLAVAAAALVYFSDNRFDRIAAAFDPWADPQGNGYQMVNSLMALGQGGLMGVGLGGSVQKLLFLPEAHTDFLFAILGEELGLLGTLVVLSLYGILAWRIFFIASRVLHQEQVFGSYLAYGVGILLSIHALINIGVNLAVLPAKGLTLPLMSYGGSNLVMTLIALAMVFRVDYDARLAEHATNTGDRKWQKRAR